MAHSHIDLASAARMDGTLQRLAAPEGFGFMKRVPITAIVTAYRRPFQTISTIAKILSCMPSPDEILVHVDGNETATAYAIENAFPQLTIIVSGELIGPGGGRNKLIEASRNEFVASFDDDSYPAETSFFSRAVALLERFPDAALIGCAITHRGQTACEGQCAVAFAPSFTGCGVVYRRSMFLNAGGYVPLALAYGMEEEDLSLRLLDQERVLLRSPWLQVHHDTDLAHHTDPKITAAQIANGALLAYLRYPKRYWLYGAAQVMNRALWSLKNGRVPGVVAGLVLIPRHLLRHAKLRAPVSSSALKAKWRARISPSQEVSLPDRFAGAAKADAAE